MDRQLFLDASNVIFFEHLMVDADVAQRVTRLFANPLDDQLNLEVESAMTQVVQRKIRKYHLPEITKHVKLIYLFLTEGIQGMGSGQSLADQQELKIKQIFESFARPDEFPVMKVIGISELRPIFAQVEALAPTIKLSQFLLRNDGKGGYDTPKIASALIQLARRDYVRQEMFLRIDDDVTPTADGLRELKATYYDLVYSPANKRFCISWNYENTSLDELSSSAEEPHYDDLFGHFVNSYSIRTTFLGEPASRCQYDPEMGELLPLQPKDRPCRLNLVHTKYFIDLFRKGRWGSSLQDPISGAGMCFSADALLDLPPWCNADELLTWIDDFVKWQLMSAYYGEQFASELGLLESAPSRGFAQDRNEPRRFTHGDVEWSTNTYLNRLLMGCILSYCVDPARYGDSGTGFGDLVKEREHLTALYRWRSVMRDELRKGATQHIRLVLQDWQHFFCAESVGSPPGYLSDAPEAPTEFVPAPADTFFNAYTLKQMMAIDQGTCDLVDKVLHVLERYLDMKYQFWPHVVKTMDTLRTRYSRVSLDESTPDRDLEQAMGWLFAELDWSVPPEPRPTTRTSRASVALIRHPDVADQPIWLLQWNSSWQVMNFVAGHREDYDPNDLACMMRELHEELFQDLSESQLAELYAAIQSSDEYHKSSSKWQDPHITSVTKSVQPPCDFPQYVAYSQSASQWSRYELKIYEVQLRAESLRQLFRGGPFFIAGPGSKPEGPNEWVTANDIHSGWTKLGRPISATVQRILCDAINGTSR